MSFNWRSGNLNVTIEKRNNVRVDLQTVQNFDFALDDNIEVMDSLNQQRIGYFYAPRRIRITMGVLPSQYVDTSSLTVSDAHTLFELQSFLVADSINDDFNYLDGIFELEVTDDHQNSVYTFNDCIVMAGGPSNIIMDRRPIAQWTILALNADIAPKDGQSVATYLDSGAIDLISDTAIEP